MKSTICLLTFALFCFQAQAQDKIDNKVMLKTGSIRITTSDNRKVEYDGYEISGDASSKEFKDIRAEQEKKSVGMQSKLIDVALTPPIVTGPILVRERPYYPVVVVSAGNCGSSCSSSCSSYCRTTPCSTGRRPCQATGDVLCSCQESLEILRRQGRDPRTTGCQCAGMNSGSGSCCSNR